LIQATGYLEDLCNYAMDLVQHRFGDIHMNCTPTSDGKAKIVILFGKSYVHFIKNEIPFEEKGVII
jgi:hypothetical protein